MANIITSTFSLKKLAKNVDNIVVDGLNLQAKYLNDDIQNGIDLGEDIYGERFKPLSMMRSKQRRQKNLGIKPLDVTGNMRKTRIIKATASQPVVTIRMIGTNKKGEVYGADHNTGKGNLPVRKWFGITKQMQPGGRLNKKAMGQMRLAIRKQWRTRFGTR